ncbi:FAD-dependent 5-carboxymethylaminomethyl-2-thiouridine(34) oxidoreductase MnmC [Ottowia sp. VDI28]|uniref:FAD-dependent 5-carboxymethylaminomethyl-2-thiouridine(34) oxidoreductase MnmC n=1 Tax=Ottowia sp. VDI28 TaxID=3133968 RepID=UPI003C2D2E06
MQPAASETVVWRDDGMPASPRFDDVYRSRGTAGDAGLAQARHVFLGGCGLLAGEQPAAWADAPCWQILETGFGLGLNFLATWHAWRADPARPQRLFYSAVEAWPPEAAHILRSAAPFAELAPLAQELASRWHGLLPGLHRLEFESGRVQLTLAIGDAQPMLGELTGQFDSIYLDGFSPSHNPDMWSLHTMKAVARLARRGAWAASWCVAGEVRERLTSCGFAVERVPGLPPKRHALRARFDPHWEPKTRAQAPLALPTAEAPRRCAIIGGGLAGASCAYSLARRGWQVTVLDQAIEPATGASGLPAGVVAPHVSPDDRPLSRLTRAGVRATLARARALLREGMEFAATGVLERHAPGERRLPAEWPSAADSAATRANTYSASAPETFEKAREASAPLDDTHLALWHAEAGWVRPAALVRAMLATPGITWQGGQAVERLEATIEGWQALGPDGSTLAEAELVILTAGFGSRALLGSASSKDADASTLPLNPLRGQVAFGPMPSDAADHAALPAFPVNGHGSLISHVPTLDGPIWVTGATFERGNARAELHETDHAHNRQRLAELLPTASAAVDVQWIDGRARSWSGVRATLPDRLPAVGAWSRASASTDPLAPHLCTGLGARGLTLAVLSGEILASWLHGEPLPVERNLAERLRAERFLT